MKKYGFIRVAAAVPSVKVADTGFNTEEICKSMSEAFAKDVSLLVFPELSLTGSTCGDLFLHKALINGAEEGVRKITEHSRGKAAAIIVGAPVAFCGRLYDCAIVIRNGNIKGIVPKLNTASMRQFASGNDFSGCSAAGTLISNGKDTVREGFGGTIRYAGQRCNISPDILFDFDGFTFAVEIGDDSQAPLPPSAFSCSEGAAVIANPSSEHELILSNDRRRSHLLAHSSRMISACIHSNCGFGESTQDYAFAGSALIVENGRILNENDRWQTGPSLTIAEIDIELLEAARRRSPIWKSAGTDRGPHSCQYSRIPMGSPCDTDFSKNFFRDIEAHPFIPSEGLEERCSEVLAIQTAALMTRLKHLNCNGAVIGVSGGLDSTLALLVAANTFDRLGWDRNRITGITMPGYGTTSRTKGNADRLMEILGITSKEISITAACDQHFKDIGQDISVHDAAYENSQARERTQILMDYANRTNSIVIGTGDLSELALGWATYNGDHMSMYGVNADVPKTMVKALVVWAAGHLFPEAGEVLLDIADTPISPELIPAGEDGSIKQVTEDLVGPYELHDFFLYNFIGLGYDREKIFFLACKAFTDYSPEIIGKWLDTFIRRFFSQQFKRSCLPDGPKIGSVGLSPRGDWMMPSDAASTTFKN